MHQSHSTGENLPSHTKKLPKKPNPSKRDEQKKIFLLSPPDINGEIIQWNHTISSMPAYVRKAFFNCYAGLAYPPFAKAIFMGRGQRLNHPNGFFSFCQPTVFCVFPPEMWRFENGAQVHHSFAWHVSGKRRIAWQ